MSYSSPIQRNRLVDSIRVCIRSILVYALSVAPSAFAQSTINYADGDVDTTGYSTSAPNNPLTLSVATGSATQSGNLTGSGSVIKAGVGALTLNGTNDYLGGTTLGAGTLRIESDSIGVGTLQINGGSLGTTADGTITSLSNNVTVTSDFSMDVIGVSGALEIFGVVDLGAASTRTITLTSTGLACFGGAVSGQGLTFLASGPSAQVSFCGDGNNTFSGPLRVGSGVVLELDKNPDFLAVAGNAVIDAGGTVATILSDQFSASSDIEVNGTLLGLFGGNNTIASLTGSGSIIADNGFIASQTLSVASGNFSGTISETLNAQQIIVKRGNGTLTLSGNNSYTGGTLVSGGTLRAQHQNAFGAGNVTVASGAAVVVEAGVDRQLGNGTLTLETDGLAAYRKDFSTSENLNHFNAITSNGTKVTEAQILYGTASANRATEAAFDNDPSSSATNDAWRISDVLSFSGLGGEIFAIQMSYTQSAYDTAALNGLYTSELELRLSWLNGGKWTSLGAGPFVAGAWEAQYTALGTFGVDAASNAVWVVTNHNSEFAVVPEPSPFALLSIGLIALCYQIRRQT